MDAELKAKWVKALRSGKFKQARGRLVKGKNHYCCIGVCGVIAGVDFSDGTATFRVAQAVGITEAEQGKLVDMNDLERRRFSTIADFIEANL